MISNSLVGRKNFSISSDIETRLHIITDTPKSETQILTITPSTKYRGICKSVLNKCISLIHLQDTLGSICNKLS